MISERNEVSFVIVSIIQKHDVSIAINVKINSLLLRFCSYPLTQTEVLR